MTSFGACFAYSSVGDHYGPYYNKRLKKSAPFKATILCIGFCVKILFLKSENFFCETIFEIAFKQKSVKMPDDIDQKIREEQERQERLREEQRALEERREAALRQLLEQEERRRAMEEKQKQNDGK